MQQIIATSVIAEYTVIMYEKAMALASNDNLGASLLPPRVEFVKPEVKDDSFLLRGFRNITDDDIHFRWLNLYETFQVCRSLCLQCLLCNATIDMNLIWFVVSELNQYCIVREHIIVDSSNMLFCIFHKLIIKFVNIVSDVLNSDHDCLQLQV